MTPEEPPDPIEIHECSYFVDYMDEYHVTLISFGPTPNRVRQYLRQRFVYSLAEVMAVRIPLQLLNSNELEAEVLQQELERIGAEAQVVCKEGGPDDGTQQYPMVRVGFAHNV
jgi:hypothetical protein